jgi:hypothetical protein
MPLRNHRGHANEGKERGEHMVLGDSAREILADTGKPR